MMSPSRLARELEARLDGPHADEHTSGAATLASESVRFLNYATGSHAGQGLEFPSTVYDVLGSLSEAACRLPQLLTQMTAWLDRANAAGLLGMDDRTSPGDAIAASAVCLEEAGALARHLGEELATAQARISRLNGRGPARDGGAR